MIHLIQRFGKDVQITRNNTGFTIVDGYQIPVGGDSTLTVRASVQPSTPEDLEMLPEGSDTKEALTVYTIEKLLPRQGNPERKGDFFTNNGVKYEVVSTKDYTSHQAMNIFYYKSIGVKVSYDA